MTSSYACYYNYQNALPTNVIKRMVYWQSSLHFSGFLIEFQGFLVNGEQGIFQSGMKMTIFYQIVHSAFWQLYQQVLVDVIQRMGDRLQSCPYCALAKKVCKSVHFSGIWPNYNKRTYYTTSKSTLITYIISSFRAVVRMFCNCSSFYVAFDGKVILYL